MCCIRVYDWTLATTILFTSLPCVSFCLYYLFGVHGLEGDVGPLARLTSLPRPSCVVYVDIDVLHGLPTPPLTACQGQFIYPF